MSLAKYLRHLNANTIIGPVTAAESGRNITGARLSPSDRLTYNGNVSGNRYSPLNRVRSDVWSAQADSPFARSNTRPRRSETVYARLRSVSLGFGETATFQFFRTERWLGRIQAIHEGDYKQLGGVTIQAHLFNPRRLSSSCLKRKLYKFVPICAMAISISILIVSRGAASLRPLDSVTLVSTRPSAHR